MSTGTTDLRTPSLYDVEIGHHRHQGPRRTFTHRMYTWLVDLDDLPVRPRWLRPFARFDARDHLGDPDRSIRANLDAWLAARGVDLEGGRIVMLAHARVLGHVFNPITVFWCHRPDGRLAGVVAEVHNTYGQRHGYWLESGPSGLAATDKAFYVSPFQPPEGRYTMSLPIPGPTLDATVTLHGDGGRLLTAWMRGRRRSVGAGSLLRLLLRQPLVPHRVSVLIRRHGIALWLRRATMYPRPRDRQKEHAR